MEHLFFQTRSPSCRPFNGIEILKGLLLYACKYDLMIKFAPYGLWGCKAAPRFICLFWRYIIYFFTYLLTFLPTYLLTYFLIYFLDNRPVPFPDCFSLCVCSFGVVVYLLLTHVCFYCVRFSFPVLSQEIGWKERLRNDLFCVG